MSTFSKIIYLYFHFLHYKTFKPMYDLLDSDKNMTELHLSEIGEVSKVKSSYSFLQVSVTE